jgi:hypothetical protein
MPDPTITAVEEGAGAVPQAESGGQDREGGSSESISSPAREPATERAGERPRRKTGMSIKELRPVENGWKRFDWNVGGFLIKRCKWKPETGAIVLPQRRTRTGSMKEVVLCPPAIIEDLQELLASGRTNTPRDRRPCDLRIHNLRPLRSGWCVFCFTVRGVTVCGCRWQPISGSIQFPITFVGKGSEVGKKRVVHAMGATVTRLESVLCQAAAAREVTYLPRHIRLRSRAASSVSEVVAVT